MIEVELPDGRIIQVDTDDPEQARRAANRFQLNERFEAEGKAQSASVQDELSTAQRAAIGFGRGLLDVGQGVKQLGLQAGQALGLTEEGSADQFTLAKTRELEEFNKIEGADSLFSVPGVSRLAGNVAATPIPGAGGASGLVRAGKVAATNAAAAGAEFVPEGGSRGLNAALGAGFGLGGEALTRGAGRLKARRDNAAVGNFADDSVGDVINNAELENVPVGFEDLSGSATAKRVGTALEGVPFVGTAGIRRDQQKLLEEAAVARFEPFGDRLDIFEGVSDSVKSRVGELREQAGRRYTAIDRKLEGSGEVALPRFQQAIDNISSNELAKGTLQDESLLKNLGDIANAPTTNFSSIRTNTRQAVKQTIREARGTPLEGSLIEAKRALELDLETFAKANGAGGEVASANKFYKDNIVPLKQRGLRNAVNENNPEVAFRLLTSAQGVRGGSVASARRLHNTLTPNGRRLVKAGLFQDAHAAASTNGNFKPGRFASELEKRVNLFEEFSEQGEVRGLINLMRHLERAGKPTAEASIATGKRLSDLFVIGASVKFPAIPALSLLTRTLFYNPNARNLLLAASTATAGSKRLDKISTGLTQGLSRVISQQQAEAN